MSKITQFAAVALIGVLAGFVGGALAASLFARRDRIQTPPDVIRAKQFEAVGEKGVARARLGLDSGDVPVMRFFGSDEKERFSIMLDNVEEPTMAMQDVKGNVRVVFGHETSDTASLSDDDWYVSFFEPEEDHFSATLGVRRSYGPAPSRKYRGVVGTRDAKGDWHSLGAE